MALSNGYIEIQHGRTGLLRLILRLPRHAFVATAIERQEHPTDTPGRSLAVTQSYSVCSFFSGFPFTVSASAGAVFSLVELAFGTVTFFAGFKVVP